MRSASKQRATSPVADIATGYLQTMRFDLHFNYIGGSVEQICVVTDAPPNWESETCKLIPHVRYEYTRVSKQNPETGRSALTRINQARKNVKFYASAATTKGAVLRIVKETIVTKLVPQNVDAVSNIELYCLEESYGSLLSDPIAAGRKTTESRVK